MNSAIDANYGFLTVVEVPELGHCGGLLLLSVIGRPIEFHCTTPVKANRAQEILYGRTFEEFLYCDQIGAALFAQTKTSADVVMTDRPPMLALAARLRIPFVLLRAGAEGLEPTAPAGDMDSDGRRHQLSFALAEPGQSDWVKAACRQFGQRLPLDEPFERIRQAIDEAHAVASRVCPAGEPAESTRGETWTVTEPAASHESAARRN